MQQSLDDWSRAHARVTDPDTSKDAARSMRGSAEAQAKALYWALVTDRGDGLTAEEAGDRCGLDNVQACRRMDDLLKANLAEPTGRKRPNRSGRGARVWRVRGVG